MAVLLPLFLLTAVVTPPEFNYTIAYNKSENISTIDNGSKNVSTIDTEPENRSTIDNESKNMSTFDNESKNISTIVEFQPHELASVDNETKILAESQHGGGVHVASLRWDYVKDPLSITLYMMAVVLATIVYHRIEWMRENVPESCVLIIVGLFIGVALYCTEEQGYMEFDTTEFFLFLLPPIILQASYSLKDRAFTENIGSILLYAVVGTIINMAFISALLYACEKAGAMGDLNLDAMDFLIFGALIAAVDPVAVLAIFQEVGVNDRLYFMVFGESLLNDAVTVVVYNLVIGFKTTQNITYRHVLLSLAAFVATSFAATLIGLLCGFMTSYILKFTDNCRVVEPMVMFGIAFLSYLFAELFHFSGIISIICCGFIQAHYALENVSSKSYITIHYSAKVCSTMAESLIFIALGVMLFNKRNFWQGWSTAFSMFALLLCTIVRFAVVFFLTYIINSNTVGMKVTLKEQLIMAYGGLRGAISFSLVAMLSSDTVPAKDALMCATFVVILFTVFVQGITLKPVVHLLGIKLKAKDLTMNKEISRGVVENCMAGMEAIVGHKGSHYWTTMVKYVSHTFIRPAVQNQAASKGKRLVVTETEISMSQHLETNRSEISGGAAIWKELDGVDSTHLPPAFGAMVLDVQDSKREQTLRRTNSKVTFALNGSTEKLDQHFSASLEKTKHSGSEQNLKKDFEGYKKFEHLTKARKISTAPKKISAATRKMSVPAMMMSTPELKQPMSRRKMSVPALNMLASGVGIPVAPRRKHSVPSKSMPSPNGSTPSPILGRSSPPIFGLYNFDESEEDDESTGTHKTSVGDVSHQAMP